MDAIVELYDLSDAMCSPTKTAGGLQRRRPRRFCLLLKKSHKTNSWSRRWFVLNEKAGELGYTKKQEDRHFLGVITVEECNIEEISDEEESSKTSKEKKDNGTKTGEPTTLLFSKRKV